MKGFPARRSRLYRKTLLYILLISSIPTVLVAGINYFAGTNQLMQEARLKQQQRFEQVFDNLNDTVENIELLVSREALSSNFTEIYSEYDFYNQMDLLKNAMSTLFLFNEANPYILNARLFIEKPGVLVTGEDGIINLMDERVIDQYTDMLTLSDKGFFWAGGLSYKETNDATKQFESLVVKVPWYTNDPKGALVIDINPVKLNNMLSGIHDEGGFAFLLTADGRRIAASGVQSPQLLQEIQERWPKGVESLKSSTLILSDKEYIVFDKSLPVSSWRLVSGVPLTQVIEPAINTSRLLIGSFIAVIAVILVISYFTSLKLYHPIRRILRMIEKSDGVHLSDYAHNGDQRLDEIEIIEAKWLDNIEQSEKIAAQMDKHMPELRKVFLMQCLLGHIHNLSEEELVRQLAEYRLNVSNKGFVLLLVQLYGLSSVANSFTENDEPLIKFAASNIIGEIVENCGYQVEIFSLHDLTIGVLLIIPEDIPKKQWRSELTQLSEKIIESFGAIIKLNISISMGRFYPQFSSLPRALDEVYNTLQHRDVHEKNQILDTEDVVFDSIPSTEYPFDYEKNILQALRGGSEEEARSELKNFNEALSEARGIEILYKQGMFQLLGRILNVILQSGIDPYTLYHRRDLYDDLNALKEPAEIVEWFDTKVIVPYIAEFNESKNIKLKKVVEQTVQLLHEDYAKDISLEYCADQVGTTTFTLSKAFKEMTGSNFIDYLTVYRLNKARELLLTTDLKVQEIAERVGYQPPHFIRTFKKNIGMTPGQYRSSNRQ